MRAAALLVLVACGSQPAPRQVGRTSTEPPAAPLGEPAPVSTPTPADNVAPLAPSNVPTWIGVFLDKGSARVAQVMHGSPAAKAGVLVGDRVVTVDGAPIQTSAELVAAVRSHAPGEAIVIVIDRRGSQVTLKPTVEARPSDKEIHRNQLLDRPAPAFAVQTLDGTTLDLASLKGKVVVIDFWASWCGPCLMALPELKRLHASYAAKGLVVVGITDDDAAIARDYIAKHGVTWSIGIDSQRDTWRRYLVSGIPTTVVIDKAGVVRYSGIGFSGDDALDAVIAKLL